MRESGFEEDLAQPRKRFVGDRKIVDRLAMGGDQLGKTEQTGEDGTRRLGRKSAATDRPGLGRGLARRLPATLAAAPRVSKVAAGGG